MNDRIHVPSEREWTEEERQWFERIRSLEAQLAAVTQERDQMQKPCVSILPYMTALDRYLDGFYGLAMEHGLPAVQVAEHCKHTRNAYLGLEREYIKLQAHLRAVTQERDRLRRWSVGIEATALRMYEETNDPRYLYEALEARICLNSGKKDSPFAQLQAHNKTLSAALTAAKESIEGWLPIMQRQFESFPLGPDPIATMETKAYRCAKERLASGFKAIEIARAALTEEAQP